MIRAHELRAPYLAGETSWSILAGASEELAIEIGYLQSVHLNVASECLQELQATLDATERARAAKFYFDSDRCRYVVARGRLRQRLARELGVEPAAVKFEYGENDKPFLARSHCTKVRFNLSHSGELAIIGVVHDREIGVDVELVRAIRDEAGIAADCFSEAEYRAYRSCLPEDRTIAFFRGWTRKEAFIKALGEGLSHPLKDFDVSLLPGQPARLLRIGSAQGSCGWGLASLEPSPDFVAAVVVSDAPNVWLVPRPAPDATPQMCRPSNINT